MTPDPLTVAFLNENTLGHGSYLPRYTDEFERRPELGIRPIRVDAVPLPPRLQRRADRTIRGLRRFGLDYHVARWRRIVSRHVRGQLLTLRSRNRIDAVVINTQSIGLHLADLGPELPLFICLDATFQELRRNGWFSRNRLGAWLHPLTLAPILPAERRLFAAAHALLPWSEAARQSLLADYHIDASRITVLPPSLDLNLLRRRDDPRPANPRPQILFIGGNFFRKGGPLLLEAFRRHPEWQSELHVVTESPLKEEPRVLIHMGVVAGSDPWFERWRQADMFVFPSRLETFGIVLLEAMAFEVPIVSSRAGAAAELLEEGRNGLLLDELSPPSLASAITAVLRNRAAATQRAQRGRRKVEQDYNVHLNSARMADLIRTRS
jgi:glycosyltransferase involved in cell wall biosynthesis